MDTPPPPNETAAAVVVASSSSQPQPHANPKYVYAEAAASGVGVYFGENDPRNASEPLLRLSGPSPLHGGERKENTAAVTALLRAYELMRGDGGGGEGDRFVLTTSSFYAIWCATKYGDLCASLDWRPNVPNRELVRALHAAATAARTTVSLRHAGSHAEATPPHPLDGTARARQLAEEAAAGGGGRRQAPPPPPPQATTTSSRVGARPPQHVVYLRVPTAERHAAKALGARWDTRRKQWFVRRDAKHKTALLRRYPPPLRTAR